MGILELLGLGRAGAPSKTVSESRHGDTETVRRIVGELGLSHKEYIKAHLAYTDKRSVFKRKG